MTRLDRARAIAVTVALLGGLPAASPAVAGILDGARDTLGDAPGLWAMPLPGFPTLGSSPVPAAVVAQRVVSTSAATCDSCAPVPVAAKQDVRRNATLSVNIAILLLGAAWVALMVRRIQQRSALVRFSVANLSSVDLARGAPQHAASGH